MLLSIDTCGPSGSIALARLDHEQLAILSQETLAGKTYSARLVPAISELLASQQIAVADLAAIIVTKGPGSFTGIRIGLSTAKGLAEVHRTPLIAVSRLQVLAHKAQTHAAALDASRHEFYFGRYDENPRETLINRDAFESEAAALGQELAICEPALQPLVPAAAVVDSPTAADALRFALARFRARDFDDPLTLDGNYLRRSDAEIFSQPGARRPKPPRSPQPEP
ncbi:MAG TPA: tRNA (adenosine(37)-N6)-threonylcarbamoyltransferase complex dimerization subunit type 1 TsaB [Acidobacteriaceae bacterium]|nr:tRNA (adenosine(37)-N6)-threonylcarbamoyltransferase complex dimerization subunit type 1 TsaB [Acidobacteriaceae bacterium]